MLFFELEVLFDFFVVGDLSFQPLMMPLTRLLFPVRFLFLNLFDLFSYELNLVEPR